MSNYPVQNGAQKGSSARVRIAACVPPLNVSYDEWLRVMLACEQAGANVLFCTDHFFPPVGDGMTPVGDGMTLESLTALAALAQATNRAEIGPFVLASAFRNPNLTAIMAWTIDKISGGRFILGIGAGHLERDFTEYGYPFGSPGSRLQELAAALPIIENRLAALNPLPVRKIPILIGASGERVALEIVAKHAHIWHCMSPRDGSSPVENLSQKTAVLKQWCARVNRPETEIERAVTLAPGQEPDPMREAGATLLVVRLVAPPYDLGYIKEVLAWRDRVNAS
jgi:probable F420-dependent oxidoreductase